MVDYGFDVHYTKGSDVGRDPNERADEYMAAAFRKIGRSLMVLTECFEEWNMHGQRVREIKIQGPAVVGEGYRAVIKVDDEQGAPQVGFRSAATLDGLVADLAQAVSTGTLHLRADEFAQGVRAEAVAKRKKIKG